MTEEKKWWQSKSVWGGIVVVAATVAGAFGYTVDGTTQAEITDLILAGVTAAGALAAIVGRVKATKTIGK